jgi:hypothetical protein
MGDGGYQRYGAYQDSGIEWLGEIPAHWKPESSLPVARLGGDRLGLKRCRDRDTSVEHSVGLGIARFWFLGVDRVVPSLWRYFEIAVEFDELIESAIELTLRTQGGVK